MNKKIITIIVLILALAVGSVFAYPKMKQAQLRKDPIKHIMYSFMQTENETAADGTVAITFKLDEEKMLANPDFKEMEDPQAHVKFINQLLERLSLNYNVISKTDYENDDLKMYLDFGVSYKDISALDLSVNFEPYKAAIDIPQLIDKAIYIDLQKAIDESGKDVDLQKIKLSEYLKALYEKDEKYNALKTGLVSYEPIVKELLDGKVEKAGKGTVEINLNGKKSEVPVIQYKLNINLDDVYNTYSKIIKQAATDETAKAFVLDRIEKIENLFIGNEDYKLFDLEKEQVESGFAELKADLNKNWEESLNGLADEMLAQKQQMAELGVEQDMSNMILSIDDNDMVRQISVDIITDAMIINEKITYNAIGDTVVVPSMPTAEESMDVIEMTSTSEGMQELQEIQGKLMENINNNIFEGEAMKAFKEDLNKDVEILPEAERQETIDSLNQAIEQMKSGLPFMLMGIMPQPDVEMYDEADVIPYDMEDELLYEDDMEFDDNMDEDMLLHLEEE